MINPFKKYPYIVVEGPIGSGKSTLSRMLSENFGAKFIKERAEQNPFLPKFYKNMTQYALPTQLFFLFQRAEQINEVKQNDFFHKGSVADFFIYKDPIFAQLNLDDEELKLYKQIYQFLELKVPKPDLVIYLQTPVELLKKRVDGRSIGYEKTISTEYLEKIAEAYSNFFHFKYINQLLIINNENLDILEDSGAVRMLIDKIDQMSSTREFFNPKII
jgi:deoxyadenosine/deoxycytidine kinase